MINEARPYASLSSGLLARKGAARPAMRPQGYSGFEDLGWNDMGGHVAPSVEPEVESGLPEHMPSSIAALTPMSRGDEPAVAAQQRAIAESFDGAIAFEHDEEPSPIEVPRRPAAKADVVPLPKRAAKAKAAVAGKSVAEGRKAAFTLRLDAERHLRLRLACAVTGRSAQQIVTAALDEALATIPEIETLAARLPAEGRKRG
jgi:hypothetical protein